MDVIIADVIGEVALILIVSSLLGALTRRLGQPRVIGQIVAGSRSARRFSANCPAT